jgi:hypothetical protein
VNIEKLLKSPDFKESSAELKSYSSTDAPKKS